MKKIKGTDLILPKDYLSYSQMSLWQKSKEQYRQRYYLDGPGFENRETIFGKKVAKMFEDGVSHPVLDLVPRGKKMEHRIAHEVMGVPVLGYLDSFCPDGHFIYEYKTGKEPWDNVRVAKHDQLVVYSLLTKLKHGRVDQYVRLVWIETRYAPQVYEIGSRTLESDSNELEFTGKVEVFKRRIAQWERDVMAKKIRKIAEEISTDYQEFLKTHE